MFHISSQSLQACNQHSLLSIIEHVLWIKDGWGVVSRDSLRWVFLDGLVSEDVVSLVAELHVVY